MLLKKVCSSVSITHKFNQKSIIFLNTSDIYNGKILHSNYSNVNDLPGQAKKTIENNDILFSEIRPQNKRYAIVNVQNSLNYVVSTKLMVIRSNKDLINYKYLYYFLTSDIIIQSLQKSAESRSGTFPQITFEEVKCLNINLVPLTLQQHIVDIIGSIDDKIENNEKIISHLHKYSCLIFKKLFSNYDKNKTKTISEIAHNVITGTTPSTKNSEYWNGGINFITIPDMQNGLFTIETQRKISELASEKYSSRLIQPFSLLVSCIATVGLVAINNQIALTNQQINSITFDNDYDLYYIHQFMLHISNDLKSLGSGGSTTANINKQLFKSINVVYPTKEELVEFRSRIKPFYNNTLSIQNENIQLKKLKQLYLNKFFN